MKNTPAFAKSLAMVIIIVLIVAAGSLALYTAVWKTDATSSSSSYATSEPVQMITLLAQSHWAAIGEKNLSLLMSQYSPGYEAVWFFINNSGIGPTNGRYDCNIPRGPNNCSYFPRSAWQTLFNNTGGAWSYLVCNLSIVVELDGRVSAHALVWYNYEGNNTIRVPYEMDFQYYNDTWAVWKEWFGLQANPAMVISGASPTTSCS